MINFPETYQEIRRETGDFSRYLLFFSGRTSCTSVTRGMTGQSVSEVNHFWKKEQAPGRVGEGMNSRAGEQRNRRTEEQMIEE